MLREIEHQRDDLVFLQQGGIIRYAVDFSEIYAYALPDKTGKEFQLFVDESEERAGIIQRQALRRLFEGSSDLAGRSDQLILLNPYAIELQSFFMNERQRHTKTISDYPSRLRHITEALAQPEYQDISRINDELKANPAREITPEESKLIANFLERYAPDLVEILDRREPLAVEAIKQLLNDTRFADLDTLAPIELHFDSRETSDWYERLAHILRAKNAIPGPNTDLDALAIALVERANELLQPRKIRLLLVTRSLTMHELLPPPVIEPGAPLPSTPHIRHPRIFSDLFAIDDRTDQELKQRLTDCADALRVLLKAVDEENPENLDAAGRARLDSLVEDLKQRWRQAEDAAMALHIPILSPHPAPRRIEPEQTPQILALLHNHEAFMDLLTERLQARITDLEQIHELLGLCLHSVTPEQQERIVAMLQVGDETQYGQLTLQQSLPYTLRFYSAPARQLLRVIGKTQLKHGDWNDVIDFFKSGFSPGSNFERVFAMAAILAALGHWNLAETYTERALQVAEAEGSPASEGYFFLAMCKRKWNTSFKRYNDAIQNLYKAIDAASAARPPRYLKEQGTQMLLSALEYPNAPSRYSAADGLDLLEEAEGTSADQLLKVECVNNRLFYFVKKDEMERRADLIADYEKLKRLQEALDANQERWPAFVLHTLALAHWKLFGIHSEDERNLLLIWIKYAQSNAYLEKNEREELTSFHEQLIKAEVNG